MTLKQRDLHRDATSLRKSTNYIFSHVLYVKTWLKLLRDGRTGCSNKENSLSEVACEVPAGCVLPKEKRLKGRNRAACQSKQQLHHLPKSCGLFLAIGEGQWHLFDRQEAAVFSSSITGTMALERSRFKGWKYSVCWKRGKKKIKVKQVRGVKFRIYKPWSVF